MLKFRECQCLLWLLYVCRCCCSFYFLVMYLFKSQSTMFMLGLVAFLSSKNSSTISSSYIIMSDVIGERIVSPETSFTSMYGTQYSFPVSSSTVHSLYVPIATTLSHSKDPFLETASRFQFVKRIVKTASRFQLAPRGGLVFTKSRP